MLGNSMSNQDEDEVEDELAALEAEVNGVSALPNAPQTNLPKVKDPVAAESTTVKPDTEREAIPA